MPEQQIPIQPVENPILCSPHIEPDQHWLYDTRTGSAQQQTSFLAEKSATICPFGPPEVRENYGFSLRELGQIKSALTADLDDLCAEWSRIHGNL